MKRLFIAGIACAVLVVPSVAGAAPPSAGFTKQVAKRGQSFAISFIVIKKGKKPVAVKKFNYGNNCKDPDVGPGCIGDDGDDSNNVPLSCDEGAIGTFLSGYLPKMKVKDGEFGGKFGLNTDANPNDAEAQVKVGGKFRHHNKKVVGILRIQGDFGDTHHNCDSTKLDWRAGLLN